MSAFIYVIIYVIYNTIFALGYKSKVYNTAMNYVNDFFFSLLCEMYIHNAHIYK